MFKILIADDDMLVRMNLRSKINWFEHGLELLDDAIDGQDAIDRIEAWNPDIVILDIGMPIMNGIQVIKGIKEMEMKAKVIVLSCHEDYDNVKEALMLGAVDYLLKHMIEAESVLKSIQKTIGIIKESEREKQHKQTVEEISRLSRESLREEFLRGILEGKITVDNNEEKTLNISFTKYILILVEIDDMYKYKDNPSELYELSISAVDIIKNALQGNENHQYTCISEGRFGIIIDFKEMVSYMSINNSAYEICKRILQNIKNYLNVTASAGISRISSELEGVRHCFVQTEIALQGKFYFGKDRIIHISEVENYTAEPKDFIIGYETELLKSITTGTDKINECIEQIFHSIEAKNISPERIPLLSFELIGIANKVVKNNHLGYEEVFGTDVLPYEYVMNLETLEDMKQWFLEVCQSAHDKVLGYDIKVDCRYEIEKALIYISDNYRHNISLKEIADYVGLSRTYFSKVFKDETGQKFIDYILRCRLEKAKLLLDQPDLKIYEIASECGFESYRYFTMVFKNAESISPQNYRRRVHEKLES